LKLRHHRRNRSTRTHTSHLVEEILPHSRVQPAATQPRSPRFKLLQHLFNRLVGAYGTSQDAPKPVEEILKLRYLQPDRAVSQRVDDLID